MLAPQPNVDFLLGISRPGSLVAIVSALTARLVGAIAPRWSANKKLRTWPHNFRVPRHSGTIPRGPLVGSEGGHFHVQAGFQEVAVSGASTICAFATRISWTPDYNKSSRPQLSRFLKEALGGE